MDDLEKDTRFHISSSRCTRTGNFGVTFCNLLISRNELLPYNLWTSLQNQNNPLIIIIIIIIYKTPISVT